MPHVDIVALAVLLLPMAVAALKRRNQGRPDGGKPAPSSPAPAEADERTRQVREEIQRRIAARRGQPARARPAAEAAPAPPSLRRLVRPAPPSIPPLDPFGGPGRDLWSQTLEPVVEPAPVERRAPPPSPAPAIAVPFPAAAPSLAPAPDMPHPWLADLRDRANLRKLVVLREVLDAPVGLRGEPPVSPRV